MVMDTIQIRLNPEMIAKIDILVKQGMYANRGDAIRDAVRKSFWAQQVGTIKAKGNSVRQIRALRKKLSKEPLDLDEINRL
jgi:Arc/MetJ-type ribon-helix-helix transcriptional regulator